MPANRSSLSAQYQNQLAYPGQDVVNAFTQGLGPMLYGAAKGTAASVAGLPGDIEELARRLLLSGAAPDSYTAQNMASQAFLPTSDRVKASLPSLANFGAGPQAQYTENVAGDLGKNVVGSLVGPEAALQAARAARQAAFATNGMPVGMSTEAVGGMDFLKPDVVEKPAKIVPTVMRPQRVAYPEIYSNPTELVAEAASRVAPEDPLLKQLFGVDRQDLWDISQQGTRKGNITERPFKAAANAKGAAHASEVMNPRNEKRLLNILEAAKQHPDLYQGMASWYTMDPLFEQFKKIYGADKAVEEYNKFNTLTGMASPGSEVLTEFNRGTAANWLAKQNRFEDFQKYGGMAEFRRGADYPQDMRGVIGHPYHSTAHSGPMSKYVESGALDMGSAKVPSYIHASGVPETGFQTEWPVGDAHWSRLVGLPDVRGATTKKGVASVPNASASVPEMTALGPWWKDRIAAQAGLEAVPAQAVVWGAGSGATGVTSPIGAGKLELLAQQIGKAAKRMNVTPETARDMIISGKAHAGFIDPKLASAIAAATSAGFLGNEYLSGKK